MHTSKTLRVFSMLLVLLLSLALFAGCKGDDKNASSDKGSEKDNTSIDNTEIVEQYQDKGHPTLPETKDLGGFEMLLVSDREGSVIPEQGESAEGDLMLEALRETQTAYNCTISIRYVTAWDEAFTSIVAGEPYANVIMPRIHAAGRFLQSRLCADFLDPEISQYIDMDQPWWNDTMAYASNVLGSVYAGASTVMSPADYTWVVYFNKDIAKEIGLGDKELYELWEKKEWTWDALLKYAKLAVKDVDGNGAVDSVDDIWGLVAPGYDGAQAFASSAKVASITTDDGMNPRYTFNTTHAITSLTKLNGIFTGEGIYAPDSVYAGVGTGKTFINYFAKGNSLFFGYRLITITDQQLRDMEDDWGLLPMPLGPKDGGGWQDKYISRVDHNFNLCVIPTTVEDKASTALVLESMSFNYFKIINDKVNTYATLYCRDDESVDIANTIYNTSTFEISQFFYSVNNYEYNRSVESVITRVCSTPNFDVSGAVQSVAEQAQIIIDNYFNGV